MLGGGRREAQQQADQLIRTDLRLDFTSRGIAENWGRAERVQPFRKPHRSRFADTAKLNATRFLRHANGPWHFYCVSSKPNTTAIRLQTTPPFLVLKIRSYEQNKI
jgi:hypothetical protein